MEKTLYKELCDLYFSSLFDVMIEKQLLNWIMLIEHITLAVFMETLLQWIFTRYHVKLRYSYS